MSTFLALTIGIILGFTLAIVILWPASAILLLILYSWVRNLLTGKKGF